MIPSLISNRLRPATGQSMFLRLAFLMVMLFMAAATHAHEVRPAYLHLQALDGDRYDLLWRVPARGDLRLSLYVTLPEACEIQGEAREWQRDGSRHERYIVHCPGSLTGQTITIDGLEATLTDTLARLERLDGTTQVNRLTPASPSFTVLDAERPLEVAKTYGFLGVEHILLGIDHLLFVLALLMIVPGWRSLIATVTAFTVAHSLTLGLATLGLVHVPQAPVEAVIALSILFVAVEIVHWKQGKPGITRERPWLVAFLFGLLHGFGFAGALSELGLPEHAIPIALLFFNLGVEAGQLLFIAFIGLVWAVLRRFDWPDWAWRLPVYSIGGLAGFWTLERLSGF